MAGLCGDAPVPPAPPAILAPVVLPGLKPGDVVFFSAPDFFWARMASRWSLPRYRHGHVGMVVDAGGRLLIVHATGSPLATDAHVVAVPLNDFLADATRVDVFRLDDAAAAVRATEKAKAFAAARLPFDKAFSLESTDQLYCSELVWRALSAGYGRDIVPTKSRVAGNDAVLLSDLENAPQLHLIATVWRDRHPHQSSR